MGRNNIRKRSPVSSDEEQITIQRAKKPEKQTREISSNISLNKQQPSLVDAFQKESLSKTLDSKMQNFIDSRLNKHEKTTIIDKEYIPESIVPSSIVTDGQTTFSAAMLNGVVEIDLGEESRLKNVAATEIAVRKLLQEMKSRQF